MNRAERHYWPDYAFRLIDGNALLIVSGVHDFSLLRLERDRVYPGLPPGKEHEVKIELQFINGGRLERETEGAPPDSIEWLTEQVGIKTSPATGNDQPSAKLLRSELTALHRHHEQRLQKRLNNHELLDDQSEGRLFRDMEQGIDESPQHENASNDPLVRGLMLLGADSNLLSRDTQTSTSDTRERLQNLLERTNLFSREVLIEEGDLDQDCGDLIGFLEDENSRVVVLKSTPQGYLIWIPEDMSRPIPLQDIRPRLEHLSPRMQCITPAFQEKHLNPLGLLRFAYGEPKETTRFVVAGLLIGVTIGFLLAIGRDVGAARWIFGMGVTGALSGACLGLLSGGFRLATGITLLGTVLGLLTPTFNTLITNQALPDRDLGLLLQMSGILVLAGVLRVSLEWVKSRALQLSQQRGAARSQLAGMHRLLRLPTEFFRQRNVGDLQLRFGALEQLRGEIQQLLEGGLLRTVLTSIYVLFMLKISVKLTGLAILIAGLIVIPTAIVGLQSRPLQRHQEEAAGQALSRNLELLNAVSKLRLAGAEARAARWWGEQFRRIVNLENALDAKEATAALLESVMPNLGTLLVYVVVTRLIAEAANSTALNAPNLGELLGFFSAFGTFIGAAAGFAGLLIGAIDIPVIYERAEPVLTTELESSAQLAIAPNLDGRISLDRVSYRYNADRPLVLDELSFEAKAGEQLAVVGPSGSGKSTLVRLLLGFDVPENGEICFDGQPLNGLRLESVRRQIGTVLQSNSLFNGSLMEAIAGGSAISEEEAWHAVELAGLADDINAMPMGLHTIVPDGGGTLSGGQRQRVGIARALVRRPKILIFDEATSALDNRTQAIVTESLASLAITRIVIAHRLSTIRQADQIIVIEHGQLQEQGTCEALMAKHGLFFRMMERQIT